MAVILADFFQPPPAAFAFLSGSDGGGSESGMPMTTRGKFVSGNTEIGTSKASTSPASVSATTRKKMVRVERTSQNGRPAFCVLYAN